MAPVIKNLSEETKKDICQAYKNGEKCKTICKMFGISTGTLHRILEIYEVPQRKPNSEKKDTKKCRYCGASITQKGALYCCMCASSLRTEKEIIVDEMEKLKSHFTIIGSAFRDEYIADVNRIIGLINKLEVIER